MSTDTFRLTHIDMRPLDIPFRVAFKHASAERSRTSAVVAIASTSSGQIGHGEGCPRPYVSGEDIDSCLSFHQTHERDLLAIRCLDDVQQFVQAHQAQIDRYPAAWCALECAVLDALGLHQKRSVEDLLGLPPLTGSFHYSAVLGVSQESVFQAQLAQYVHLGFLDFKIKISGDLDKDKTHLQALKAALPNANIRLDGNNLWPDADAALPYLNALKGLFWAVEEPIKPKDFAGLQELAQQLDCQIILDESLLSCADLEIPQKQPALWLANIRVSKMGGVLRSLQVAHACSQAQIPIIVGAQVGETSLLTRAALTVVHAHRASVRAQEGAFGTLLLASDITTPCLMFGAHGALDLAHVQTAGWGLHCQPTAQVQNHGERGGCAGGLRP